eukprot:835492-Rhodomonas_salina.1
MRRGGREAWCLSQHSPQHAAPLTRKKASHLAAPEIKHKKPHSRYKLYSNCGFLYWIARCSKLASLGTGLRVAAA